MSAYDPIFRSPITIPELQSPISDPPSPMPNLTLSDLTGAPVALIQGEARKILENQFGTVPQNPGGLVDVGEGLLACLTPLEFYLFGKTAAAELPSVAGLNSQMEHVHASDLTHGKAVLRLLGSQAGELLKKICGLDFFESSFPNLYVAQSSVAKIKTLIARYDRGNTPAYFLHVERALGQYFWETVWDAGQEFGIALGH